MKKRGISPVIATVLLIAMVVVIGVIIFLWFRGMTTEVITKFGGKNIELVCGDVDFDASYYGGTLSISNDGNVPIYGMKIKISKEKGHNTVNLDSVVTTFQGLNQGGTFSGDISSEVAGAESIILIPILLGSSEEGKKTFVCDENLHGYELII